MSAPQHPTIAFLVYAEQFERLDIHPDWLVLTGDLQLQVKLENQGRRYIDFWDFFRVEEDDAHIGKAWELCDMVGRRLAGRVLLDEWDLVRGMCNDLLWGFRASMNAAKVLERVRDRYPDHHWVYENQLSEAMYWDSPEPPTDSFNAIAAWVAGDRGRAIGAGKPTREKPLEVEDRCPDFDPEWLHRTIRFLSYAEGGAWVEQGQLLDSYDDPEKAWLVMGERFSRGGMPAQSLAELQSFPFDTRTALAAIDAVVAEARGEWEDGPACIFENPHMEFLWDSFGRWLKAGVHTYHLGKLAARAYRPHAVVTGSDVAGSVRAFTRALRAEGVPVISIDHWGIKMDETHLRHQGALNHAMVCGQYELAGHRAWRPSEVQVRALGTLRQGMQFEWGEPRDVSRGRKRIVLFTSQPVMHGHMMTWVHPRAFKQSWMQLLDLFRQHPDWEVIIKPHPYSDHFGFYESPAFQDVPNVCMRRDLSTQDALEEADLAMIINIHTAVLPEILVNRVPVIYLKDAVAYPPCEQMEDGGAVVLDRVEDLEATTERLLEDEAFREETLEKARDFLSKVVVATGTEALVNLVRFVDDVAEAPTRPACPSARWVMDLNLLLLGLRYGRLSWDVWLHELDRLAERGAELDFDELDFVDLPLLGSFLLHLYMHHPVVWPVGSISPVKAAGALYFKLPAAIRPGWDVYRSCLVLAFTQRAASAGAIMRSGLNCMLFLLAPGRFLKRAG